MKHGSWFLFQKESKALVINGFLRTKLKVACSVEKYKSKVASKRFQQFERVDYTYTFSLIVKPITIWVVLILSLSQQWKIRQSDVNTTFLNGDIQEEVYMTQLLGFEDPLVSRLYL